MNQSLDELLDKLETQGIRTREWRDKYLNPTKDKEQDSGQSRVEAVPGHQPPDKYSVRGTRKC